jgi:hypothetical protein
MKARDVAISSQVFLSPKTIKKYEHFDCDLLSFTWLNVNIYAWFVSFAQQQYMNVTV